MKKSSTPLSLLLFVITFVSCPLLLCQEAIPEKKKSQIIFATFAEDEEQSLHAQYLAESIRAFAGAYKNSPIWIFLPENLKLANQDFFKNLKDLKVEVKTSRTPSEALIFPFSKKVFAAGAAESEAEKKTDILVWMDEDTLLLKQPDEFILKPKICFGYRPVMHQLIGSDISKPVDGFWSRIYSRLSIKEEMIFPMTTPADHKTIRPYFNAGLLVVRPERGILRRWGQHFKVIYNDDAIVAECFKDRYKRIFLHQTALVGAALTLAKRQEMVELSNKVNYPLFFEQMFQANEAFGSIKDIVSLRYDVYFRKPDPLWHKKLKGAPEQILWMKERLGKKRK